MDFKMLGKSFAILLAVSLLAYAFSVLGVAGTAIDSVWKLVALDIGVSILTAAAYPYIRGVRKGDELATNGSVANIRGMGMNFTIGNFGIADSFALSNGRVGKKIRIRLLDGRAGEGKIVEYAGLFSPARIQVTEIEKPAPQAFPQQ